VDTNAANGTDVGVLLQVRLARGPRMHAWPPNLAGGCQVSGLAEIQVAISYLGITQALRNLDAQAAGRSYAACLAAAETAWERELQRVCPAMQEPDAVRGH
jgi:hypothetical protein